MLVRAIKIRAHASLRMAGPQSTTVLHNKLRHHRANTLRILMCDLPDLLRYYLIMEAMMRMKIAVLGTSFFFLLGVTNVAAQNNVTGTTGPSPIQAPGQVPIYTDPTGTSGSAIQPPGQVPDYKNSGNSSSAIKPPGQVPDYSNPNANGGSVVKPAGQLPTYAPNGSGSSAVQTPGHMPSPPIR